MISNLVVSLNAWLFLNKAGLERIGARFDILFALTIRVTETGAILQCTEVVLYVVFSINI